MRLLLQHSSEESLARLVDSFNTEIAHQKSHTSGSSGLALVSVLCSVIGWENPTVSWENLVSHRDAAGGGCQLTTLLVAESV